MMVARKFKDFVTLQRGFDLPNGDRTPGPYPVIASTGANGFHNSCRVQAPGVTTRRSGSLGTVLYVDQPFWPLNTTLWVKDFKGNDPKYVFYLLQTLGVPRGSGCILALWTILQPLVSTYDTVSNHTNGPLRFRRTHG